MFLTRAAILSILLAGSDAFSTPKLGRGVSMSLKSSAGVLSTPVEVEKPEQKEDGDEEKKEIDVSVPYDATVRLAYEATDESTPYEEFKVKYLADAVADVVAKKPVDLSVPYEATIQLAFEASDRSMSYEDFKPKYLADAVADVVAKQSGDQTADAAPVAASAEEQEVQEASTEEQETSASDGEQQTEEVTASNDEASATDEAEQTEVVTASNEEETESDADEAQETDEVTASNEEGASSDEEEKKEEKEDDVVYYKRTPVKDEDLYLWKPKNDAEKAVVEEKRKEREGKYTLKKNEERSIFVKNLDRSQKKKPEKKKVVKKTREEKRAEKEERKAARKARTGRRVLTIAKKTSVEKPKVEVGAKKEVKMSSDNEGLFAPAVLLTKEIIGITVLNKLRGKIIKMHSEVIGGLTETAQSEFGNQVLKVLFNLADKNGDGSIDEEELSVALRALGFDFLKEKEIAKIFDKADDDKNGTLDFEEWSKAAPPTLKKNLTKLAKKNGHDLGFLAK
eukprot:CAMPEP_0197184182 /NCGR_PEP_ID=MMETSP1423-20130617/9382_1 /TAXON_ID=476441 /ORGANISM="Pseudo-nitzschia heimii, Strain UNC1101" /LENGTH=509 /DNA_ID=CAMNT_0042634945 /DNA_START=105 /DNA_END=1634 /DNA_ORIENTATION=-